MALTPDGGSYPLSFAASLRGLSSHSEQASMSAVVVPARRELMARACVKTSIVGPILFAPAP
jgi:hypothetical protein